MGPNSVALAIDNTDWVTKSLDGMFDPGGLLVVGVFFYNCVLLTLASWAAIWFAVRSVVATAQTGRVMGRHNEFWAPIRFITAIGLVVPLPPVGMTLAQGIYVGLAKLGSAAGNQLWAKAGEATSAMRPLVIPTPPAVHELAHGVWLIVSCIEAHNLVAASSGGQPVKLTTHEYSDRYMLSGDGESRGQCGTMTFGKPEGADSPLAASMQRAHIAATVAMAESMRPAASQLAKATLPPFPGTTAAVNFDVGGTVTRYSGRIQQVSAQLVAANNQNQQAREAFAKEATKGGWVNAGLWPMKIMAANAELSAALNTLPGVQPPRMDFYQGQVHAGFVGSIMAADDWWVRHMGEADPQIDAQAYSAGVEDSWFAPVDLARWKGIYSRFGVDAETSTNPLAEISNLGHSLLTFVGASTAAYTVMAVAGDKVAKGVEMIPIIGKPISKLGASVVGAVNTVTGSPENTSTMFWLVMGVLYLCGLVCAFVLPIMPYGYWLLVVARFMARVLLGIIAAPLWAIAHLDIADEEGMGARTRAGYMLALDIFIRPMASVLVMLFGLALFIVLAKLLAATYYPAVRVTLNGHFGGFSGMFAFTVLSVVFVVMLMHYCMRFVVDGVDDAIEFAGLLVGRAAGGSGADQANHLGGAVAVATTAGQKAAGATMNPAGNAGKGGHTPEKEGVWRPRMEDSIPSADKPKGE